MKRITALLCAAALCCLCASCRWVKPDPPPSSTTLLTLYADKAPLRIVTQQEGVTVTLQALEYEPTMDFLRPVEDIWKETLEPGKTYEIEGELVETVPQHRLFIQQGENIAVHNLSCDGKDGSEVFEIEGRPWAPTPVDENSPMANLCRAAAVAMNETDNYSYWYAVSNAVSTQRGVYNEWPPDDPETGAYHVPEWLFKAYAAALFPDTDMPEQVDWEWIGYDDTEKQYLVYPAWSTWIWADYKSAKQNPDGTWDVTITMGTTDDDETMDDIIKLAPNGAYNPDSPFEYHIVGMGDNYEPPEPTPPPPDIVVGTWRAPVKRGHVAYLEIFADGMAGLYLGDDESDQLYEIYGGTVCPADDTDIEGTGVDYLMDMDFSLNWYIYESDDGTPIIGVPDSYKGTYTLRHTWEGHQQVLYVKANDSADPLYGRKELKMLWVPKTEGGGVMTDVEAMG